MPMRDLRTLLMKRQVMKVIRNLDQEVTNPLRTMMTMKMRMMTMNWNYSENMLKLRRKERRNKEEKNSKKSRS